MKPKAAFKILGLLGACNTVGFYYFLVNMGRQFSGDWTDYFGPLSLFNRSAFLHYHTFPLHFPWRCGGSDLIVNPQTRLFSPFLFLDLVFPPQWAILLTMLLLATFGSFAMFCLLKDIKVRDSSAVIGALLFTSSSWFTLHFTEGHLTYAEMQLLPAVLLFFKSIESPRSRFWLMSLFSLMILNGAIQALIYSVLLIACCLFVFPQTIARLLNVKKSEWVKLMILGFLITAPKIIPVWITLSRRQPMLDSTVMSAKLLFTALLYPWQEFRMEVTKGLPYVFHEFGCYLGWSTTLLVTWSLFQPLYRKTSLRFFAVFLFWLWAGSGWGTPFNPWVLLQRIPILNQAHLQSRLFVLMFLFFTILVAQAIEQFKNRTLFIAIAIITFTELTYVRFHITRFLSSPFTETSIGATTLIRHDNLDKTVHFGIPLTHYLSKNISATDCNERAFFPSQVRYAGEPGYRGEIYLESGEGSASLARYIPGQLEIRYSLRTPSTVAVNTNHLWGWKSNSPVATVTSKTFGETLKVSISQGEGIVTLLYRPKYFWPCLLLFFIGLCFYSIELRKVMRF